MVLLCVGEWFFHAFEREFMFSISGPSGNGAAPPIYRPQRNGQSLVYGLFWEHSIGLFFLEKQQNEEFTQGREIRVPEPGPRKNVYVRKNHRYE